MKAFTINQRVKTSRTPMIKPTIKVSGFVIGIPQCGHFVADVLISFSHSLHFIIAMPDSPCLFS
jgi:hypothetical protein